MISLSHSEAHEQIADLALEPAALHRLARHLDGPISHAAADPLAVHVETCTACRAEIGAWQRLHCTVIEALGGPDEPMRLADLATDQPATAPESLRAAVAAIAAGAAGGRPGDRHEAPARPAPLTALSGRRPFGVRLSSRLLPLAAVLAVVAVAGGLLVDQSGRLDRATADTAALARVTATLDRVILDPAHRAVTLRAADGSAGGSVVWSNRDLVVLTTDLAPPPADAVYRCWVERDGRRSPIGRMYFADGTGYWTGSLDAWATTSFAAGSTFGISLEPVAGPSGSSAVLVAQLGS